MATIKDVAGAAGVSVATVSRVLNDNGYVHEDTRTKVMLAMEKLNYYPNEVARSLYKRESRLVGLLLPDITNPFFPQLARGAEDELQREGYRLIIGNSDEELEKELDYLQTFKQNQVAGILAATHTPTFPNTAAAFTRSYFWTGQKKAPHPYSVTGGQAENGRLRKCFAAKAQASRLSKAQATFRPLRNVLTAHLMCCIKRARSSMSSPPLHFLSRMPPF